MHSNFYLSIGTIVGAGLMLAGCATHTWAPGPNAQGTFEEAKARCSLMARASSQHGFYAYGRPGFVAGAALGNAIGNAIEQQANFNDCMSADGWIVADAKAPTPTPVQANAASHLQTVISDSKSCIEAIRQKPGYLTISSHILVGAQYSLVQLSDTNFPTPEEATLISSYGDETAQCRETAIKEIELVDPRAARTLTEISARVRDLAIILIHRQITWGEHAQQVQGVLDAAAAGRPIPAVYTPPPPAPVQPRPANISTRNSRNQGTQPTAIQPISTPVCTHQQEVEARIARMNGYTGGPKCD